MIAGHRALTLGNDTTLLLSQVKFAQPVVVTGVTATSQQPPASSYHDLPQLFKGYAKNLLVPSAAGFAPLFSTVEAVPEDYGEEYAVDQVCPVCLVEVGNVGGHHSLQLPHIAQCRYGQAHVWWGHMGSSPDCMCVPVQVFPTQHVFLRARCRSATLQLLGYAAGDAPHQIKVHSSMTGTAQELQCVG